MRSMATSELSLSLVSLVSMMALTELALNWAIGNHSNLRGDWPWNWHWHWPWHCVLHWEGIWWHWAETERSHSHRRKAHRYWLLRFDFIVISLQHVIIRFFVLAWHEDCCLAFSNKKIFNFRNLLISCKSEFIIIPK